MVGIGAERERGAASLDRASGLEDPVEQEGVVPQVGAGVSRMEAEVDHERKVQGVGRQDGCVERGVVARALSALHPVDDAAWHCRDGAVPANSDAKVGSK